MKKILIFGLKEPIGGVEKIVSSYIWNFPRNKVVCDFIIFGNKFSLEKEIIEKGGKVFYLPNRIKSRREYKTKIEAIFKENKYDAVWANFSGLTNIDVLKLGKKYGVPVRIAHSHAAALTWNGRIMKYLVPLFHNKNKAVIDKYATDFWGCSKPAGDFMFPKRIKEKVKVVNNAVDTSVFCPDLDKRLAVRKELGLGDSFVVCHIARMCKEKNQMFMLEVFKELLKKENNAKLLFVGDGELKQEIIQKAKSLKIMDNIIFTGFKTQVADYYKASDVFLFPSICEGLGLSLIEAQACGLPCVASNMVPFEADITGCVKFVGLDEPINVWVDAILEISRKEITDASSALKKANYDIKTEAEKMCDFFVNKVSK